MGDALKRGGQYPDGQKLFSGLSHPDLRPILIARFWEICFKYPYVNNSG